MTSPTSQRPPSSDTDLERFFAPARRERLTMGEKTQVYSQLQKKIPALRDDHSYGGSLLWQGLSRFFPTMAPIVALLVIVVLTGAGVTFAEQSLPGDFLYPVKQFNEEMSVRWTLSPESKADVQAGRMGKRLEEAAVLEEKGKLTESVTDQIDQEYRRERREALRHIQTLETEGRKETASLIRARMNATEDRYERLFKGRRRNGQESTDSSSSALQHRYPTIKKEANG